MLFWTENKKVLEKPFALCLSVSRTLCLTLFKGTTFQPGFGRCLKQACLLPPVNAQFLEVPNSLFYLPGAESWSGSTWQEGWWVKSICTLLIYTVKTSICGITLSPKSKAEGLVYPKKVKKDQFSQRVTEKYRGVFINFQVTGWSPLLVLKQPNASEIPYFKWVSEPCQQVSKTADLFNFLVLEKTRTKSSRSLLLQVVL